MIDLNGVSKCLGKFQLQNIAFNLPGGYICGLVGQNGAGKTTLLHLLLGLYNSADKIGIWTAITLPMLSIFLSGTLHPIGLPKMMYLCPMSMEERREYIIKSFVFKMMLHAFFAIVSTLFLILCSESDGIAMLSILFNELVFSLLFSVVRRGGVLERSKEAEWGDALRVLLVLVNLILAVVWLLVLIYDPSATAEYIILGVMFLLEVPMLFQYLKYVKMDLQSAVEYENDL